MKNLLKVICVMMITLIVFSACKSKDEDGMECDYPPGIMYDGSLYGVTDSVFDEKLLGEEVGTIISVIDGSEGMPKEELETNCYGLEDLIYSYGKDALHIAVLSNDVHVLLEKVVNDELTIEEYKSIPLGTLQEEVHKRLGDPDGFLSGLYGDIYLVDDLRVIFYYEYNKEKGHKLEEIKVTETENNL